MIEVNPLCDVATDDCQLLTGELGGRSLDSIDSPAINHVTIASCHKYDEWQ